MVKIYNDQYYDNRITTNFITTNNHLFQTKKIIFLFNIFNYKHYIKNKKFGISTYYFYNYYSIYNINNKIVDKQFIRNFAITKYDFLKNKEFITYPICIFENVTIECILIKNMDIKDFFIDKNNIISKHIFLVNNFYKNINLIENILKVILNHIDKKIKIKIENNFIDIQIKHLFQSLIPYY